MVTTRSRPASSSPRVAALTSRPRQVDRQGGAGGGGGGGSTGGGGCAGGVGGTSKEGNKSASLSCALTVRSSELPPSMLVDATAYCDAKAEGLLDLAISGAGCDAYVRHTKPGGEGRIDGDRRAYGEFNGAEAHALERLLDGLELAALWQWLGQNGEEAQKQRAAAAKAGGGPQTVLPPRPSTASVVSGHSEGLDRGNFGFGGATELFNFWERQGERG